MRAEPERRTVVDADRLEHGLSAKHGEVVRMQHGLVDRHDAGAETREREQRHAIAAGSGAPIAASSGRAFTHDSSTSSRGSESQTMPPPAQR